MSTIPNARGLTSYAGAVYVSQADSCHKTIYTSPLDSLILASLCVYSSVTTIIAKQYVLSTALFTHKDPHIQIAHENKALTI